MRRPLVRPHGCGSTSSLTLLLVYLSVIRPVTGLHHLAVDRKLALGVLVVHPADDQHQHDAYCSQQYAYRQGRVAVVVAAVHSRASARSIQDRISGPLSSQSVNPSRNGSISSTSPLNQFASRSTLAASSSVAATSARAASSASSAASRRAASSVSRASQLPSTTFTSSSFVMLR